MGLPRGFDCALSPGEPLAGLVARALVCVLVAGLVVVPAGADAQLLTGFGGPEDFGANELSPVDDTVSAAIDLTSAFGLGSGLQYYGVFQTSAFVSENGLLSFGAPFVEWSPSGLVEQSTPFIAPWWGDADTSGTEGIEAGENRVYWHLEEGLLVVTWYRVGYFDQGTDLLNTFQLVLRERLSRGLGFADVEFRYGTLEWDLTDSSGADDEFPQVGFSAGDASQAFALPESGFSNVREVGRNGNVRTDVYNFQLRGGAPGLCGNDIVEGSEECDDGGLVNFDGCTSECELPRPLGGFCFSDFDCESTHCASNGVCCSEPCAADCEACSPDGAVCEPAADFVICRFSAGSSFADEVCDPPEFCDGVRRDCPPDEIAPAGTDCSDPLLCASVGACFSRICDITVECDDFDPCTVDRCEAPGEIGCVSEPIADCDAGVSAPDAGALDAGTLDAGALDAGTPAFDAAIPRGTPAGGGIVCAARPGSRGGPPFAALLLLALVPFGLLRRRR